MKDSFANFGLSFMKVLVMFVGELDYTDMLVNGLSQSKAGVPYVPLPELTFTLFAIFFMTVPILLMNLLVSNTYKLVFFFKSGGDVSVLMYLSLLGRKRERNDKSL